MLDALDVNWRVGMSRVRSNNNSYCVEPRKAVSGRSCASFAEPLATIMSMNRDFLPSLVGYKHGRFEPGRATERGGGVFLLVRSRQARRTGMRNASAPIPWATVEVSCPPADIFLRELREASAKDGSSRRGDAPQRPDFHHFRTTKAKLRCSERCERGLNLCR